MVPDAHSLTHSSCRRRRRRRRRRVVVITVRFSQTAMDRLPLRSGVLTRSSTPWCDEDVWCCCSAALSLCRVALRC